jgi:hypothetical protein
MRLVVYLLFLLFLISCRSPSRYARGKHVFNYNEMAGLSSLDPAAASNFENIWPV